MGLHKELPDTLSEVDVIIAGGGTAGCIVAARLADAEPNLSILMVEGGSNNDLPTITFPAFFSQNLTPGSKANIFYQTNPEKQLGGRQVIVPSGGVLGGGSSTNLMMYTRAQRSDFDSWGVPGWGADEMVPYLKKLETYHWQDHNNTHGHDGPIHVSSGTFTSTRIQDQFVSAAEKMGWPEIQDLQDLESCNGAQRALRYISPDGKRQDTASRYLHPRLQDGNHPNLHVIVESQVIRVVIENGRAVGVEFKRNPLYSSSESPTPSPVHIVKAQKMVVVSCGALGTPPVLERSGLGDPAILQRAGVSVVVPLPGVGHEYEDHQLNIYPYRSSLNPDETADALTGGRLDPMTLIQTNDKLLGWNAMDVTCKIRPSKSDISTLGPAFQNAWKRDFEEVPDRPLAMMSPLGVFPGNPATVPVGQYFSVSAFTVYPYSRGHIHITGPSPSDRLDFVTGFFSDPEGVDIKEQLWLYKTQREIVRRMPVYRGEVAAAHPPFPGQSKAAAVELDGPLGHDITNIEYTPEDDAIIEQWLRENVGTTWHSLGTCKMGSREKSGVVDAKLNVYGVEGLKIADLSVVPRNVAANTNNTAMVIGEKAADIIIGELKGRRG